MTVLFLNLPLLSLTSACSSRSRSRAQWQCYCRQCLSRSSIRITVDCQVAESPRGAPDLVQQRASVGAVASRRRLAYGPCRRSGPFERRRSCGHPSPNHCRFKPPDWNPTFLASLHHSLLYGPTSLFPKPTRPAVLLSLNPLSVVILTTAPPVSNPGFDAVHRNISRGGPGAFLEI